MSFKVISQAPEVRKALPARKRQALDASGITVEGAAKQKTPVETGRLRSSIAYRVINDDEVHIGTNVEYAIFVHENLDAYHAIGQAKFLEDALAEQEKTVRQLITKALTEGLPTA